MNVVKVKRVYELPHQTDGKRILVDRLWPRGLTKEKIAIDLWMKDIAPSTELRKRFNHKPELFVEFKEHYLKELQQTQQINLLEQIREWASTETVTLVYAAKDVVHNHAVVLQQLLIQ